MLRESLLLTLLAQNLGVSASHLSSSTAPQPLNPSAAFSPSAQPFCWLNPPAPQLLSKESCALRGQTLSLSAPRPTMVLSSRSLAPGPFSLSASQSVNEDTNVELERMFEERIAKVAPAMLEALNAGPGAMAVADNVLGLEQCEAMRAEAIAVTERGLLRGSASAYSTAPPATFEERYGDEPGIAASVLSGNDAEELAPLCGAYISAASRALSRVLGEARRGKLEHVENEERPTDHQLRLTTVAQQCHMDNSFDGKNRRLLTTLYYLNPEWQPEHGGRFIPWPCSDADAVETARQATLPSTMLSYDDLPFEAQAQIPDEARDRIRLRISRKLAPSSEYEDTMAESGRHRQGPVDPIGDRLVAFYSDELLHSVEPVATPPLIREGGSLSVHPDGRFAISLWLPSPDQSAILPHNPAQDWLAQLQAKGVDIEATDPIGGTLHIEEVEESPVGPKEKGGFGGASSKKKPSKKGGKKKGRK